jgi:hypothetical protein
MRIAAGILLITFGVARLIPLILIDLRLGIHGFSDPYFVLFFISAAFVVAGGTVCLKRRYWILCFSSALAAVLLVVYWLAGGAYSTAASSGIFWLFTGMGALPIIFVCFWKREWQESQA